MKGLYFCLRQRHSLEDGACQHSEEIISQNSCSPLCYDFISWNTAPYIKLHKTKSRRSASRRRVSSLQVKPRKREKWSSLFSDSCVPPLGANLFCLFRIFAGNRSLLHRADHAKALWMNDQATVLQPWSPSEENLLNWNHPNSFCFSCLQIDLYFCVCWSNISTGGSAKIKRNILANEEFAVSVVCWRLGALLKVTVSPSKSPIPTEPGCICSQQLLHTSQYSHFRKSG